MKKLFFILFMHVIGTYTLYSMQMPDPISTEAFTRALSAAIKQKNMRFLKHYFQGQNYYTQHLLAAILEDDEETVYEILEAKASMVNILHAKSFATVLGRNKCTKALTLYQ